MTKTMPYPLRRALPVILPLIAIVIARLMTFTDWAAQNSCWAAAIFAWIVFDGLALGLLAKASGHRPTAFQALGITSLAGVVILVGAANPIRQVYFALPEVLLALALTAAVFVVWSIGRCIAAYRNTRSAEQALGAILPELQVRFVMAELRTIRLALFSWGEAADVPQGWRAFCYHMYLTPMIATFVALQLIELSVVHFLLMLWNPTVAWMLLGLSVWGVIWTVALLKSFRINPVLLNDTSIRARSGMIYDVQIERAQVANWDKAFSSEELKQKNVLNLAILSSPNVSLRLREPVVMRTLFGGSREIHGVALRLEDSAAFLAELAHAQRDSQA